MKYYSYCMQCNVSHHYYTHYSLILTDKRKNKEWGVRLLFCHLCSLLRLLAAVVS